MSVLSRVPVHSFPGQPGLIGLGLKVTNNPRQGDSWKIEESNSRVRAGRLEFPIQVFHFNEVVWKWEAIRGIKDAS